MDSWTHGLMSMSVSALRFWFIKLFMWIPSCGFNMNFQISCRPCNSSLSKSETQKQWLAETRFQHVTCVLKPIISKNAFGIGSGWCNQETTNLWVCGYEWLYESLCNPDQPCQISKVLTRGSLWQPHPQVDKHRVEPGMSLRGQIQNPLAKFFV